MAGGGSAATRRSIAALLLGATVQAAYTLAFPLFLLDVLALRAHGSAALIFGLVTVAAAFQLVVVPPLLGHLQERGAAEFGFALVAIGCGLTAMAVSLPLVLVAGILAVCGLATLAPSLTAMLALADRILDRGALMGVNQSVASVGQLIGPLLGYGSLALSSGRGLGLTCVVMALCGLAAARSAPVGQAHV